MWILKKSFFGIMRFSNFIIHSLYDIGFSSKSFENRTPK